MKLQRKQMNFLKFTLMKPYTLMKMSLPDILADK